MAMAEADWSELPKDLLDLISEQLNSKIDLIRFRSICSTWRSSTIPYHDHILPFKLPLSRYNTSYFCYLSKCSYFLIKPSPQQEQEQTLVRRPWLMRIAKNSTGKTKLLKLDSSRPPSYFRSTHLDFIKLSVLHLGTNFIVDKPLRYGSICNRYPKKVVAVTPFILAILFYFKNRLVLLRYGDERWTEIPDMSSPIEDICVFKGQLYAVEELSSKIFTVAPEDLSVRLVANDVHQKGRGDTKFLVESEDELLLVDVYESFGLAYEDALKINVFRLDEKEKEWVKVPSLGDRILFLGKRCSSFSISSSDLYVAKGNCVIFMEDVFVNSKLCESSGMCIFDLDEGQLSPLCDFPDYLNLFWPPPKWIIKGCMHKSKKREKRRKRTRDTRLSS